MLLSLKQLAEHIGARFIGQDQTFLGAHFDSRLLKPGELFVALAGQNQDGHAFIPQAIQAGASALLVNHEVSCEIPQIVVADTRLAFGQLASLWRQQFQVPVIAITGSCGKTTTKEMIASILRECGQVLASQGNYNNDIGVPFTLLQLRPEHRFVVLELGTNQPGEIAYIADIARPTVALITNIHASHLEKLDSFEGVSQEKSDIFKSLSAQGIAIINLDEPFAQSWDKKISVQHRVSYALKTKADVMAEHIHQAQDETDFDLITPLGKQSIRILLPGEHIVMNALAAVAATMPLGCSLTNVAQGLAKVIPIKGRFVKHILPNGCIIIDDTYNASFPSVINAIQTLGHFPGHKIFVMSNMGEMGNYAERFHFEMGERLAEQALEAVFLFGDETLLKATLRAYPKACYFANKSDIVAALKPLLIENTMVVIKGSRANGMEEIVKEVISPCST